MKQIVCPLDCVFVYLTLLQSEGQLACTEQPLGLLIQALCTSSFAVHYFIFTLHLFIMIFTLLRMRVQYVASTGYDQACHHVAHQDSWGKGEA